MGKFSKAMDIALPGKHTRELYDKLKRREASMLAQLRTGMTRLNGFLSRIGAVDWTRTTNKDRANRSEGP